ncbi:type III polyketide synthase [Planosporangium sp. 12N6]|uniref:type III polyketide synthase n=1 Tax=Planosporangium spinosum TaxID=3402278 RepID=UPI003CEF0B50
MTEPRPAVAAVRVTHPPPLRQDEMWRDFFAGHYAGVQRGLAQRIFANAGVVTRHGVVNPALEDVSGWSTKARMERYLVEALPLGKEAAAGALAAAGLDPTEVGLFAVCSCTGYATPGLDILLARDLGMSVHTQRLFIGHMGCYAALPGLGVVTDFVAGRGRPALLLCVELTTLHLQPPSRDPQQIVAHALFSDAAAAVVVRPGRPDGAAGYVTGPDGAAGYVTGPDGAAGYTVREVTAVTDTSTADHMTWDVTDLGFRMGLSARVPDVLAEHVGPLVRDLLARHGLAVSDVDGWAVHPGGPKILDVVRDRLGLSEERIAPSRETLATHGNCSSPTVLMILDTLWRSPTPPRRVVALAFGPGLTLYVALLSAG